MLKRGRMAAIVIPLIVLPMLILPATAYYFDLQDFETDKLVYEVGETVNMAARLIADYGSGGWCRITFGFVSDQGPVFAEESNITASAQVRTFNKSYPIHPSDTSPGESGCTAFAIFSAEIYDTVSERDGRNIEVTITRGHLTVIPTSSLEFTYGMNTSISLKIVSIHNSAITRTDGTATVRVTDSQSEEVLRQNSTIDSEGSITFEWNSSLGSAGVYDLTVSTQANQDFFEMNETLTVTVLPAYSNLTIVEAPDSVFSKSPDGIVFETIEPQVLHTDMFGFPLEGSTVWWNTSYDSGFLDDDGNGLYSSSIPILFSPGEHNITISASHDDYQCALAVVDVEVIPNLVTVTIELESTSVTQGTSLELDLVIQEHLTWNLPIELRFSDYSGEIDFGDIVDPGTSKTIHYGIHSGIAVGHHTIMVTTQSDFYSISGNASFDIVVTGTMSIQALFETAFYAEELHFNLSAVGSSNETLHSVSVFAHLDHEIAPFGVVHTSNSTEPLSFILPTRASPGIHNLTLRCTSEYYNPVQTVFEITIWMRTNISIVITTMTQQPLGSFLNQLDDLVRFNHPSAPNPVQRNHLGGVIHDSRNFPGKLPEILLRHDYLTHSFSEGFDGIVRKGPQGPQTKRLDIVPFFLQHYLFNSS